MIESNLNSQVARPAISVLVVDDEPVIASEIIEFLSFEDIYAVAASDGETALQCLDIATPGSFTVLVTDVRMPGISGLELASDVRAMASEPNAIEVILMTGHGSHRVAQDASLIPAFECMAKPLSLSLLLDTIRRAHAATVLRRVSHWESIDRLVQLLAKAEALTSRPQAPGRRTIIDNIIVDESIIGNDLAAGALPALSGGFGFDWRYDPLGFVLAQQTLPNAMTDSVWAWQEAVLDRAADQARTLLPNIQPLTELLVGRRLAPRALVALAAVLESLADRHAGTLIMPTAPTPTIVLMADEQLLGLVLDQIVDDVLRSGPAPLPIQLDIQMAGNRVTLRVIGGLTGCAGRALAESASDVFRNRAANSDGNMPDTGGLGLQIAAAAARLQGSRIERQGTRGCVSMTSLVLTATPADTGIN